jgi:hypothetical protein
LPPKECRDLFFKSWQLLSDAGFNEFDVILPGSPDGDLPLDFKAVNHEQKLVNESKLHDSTNFFSSQRAQFIDLGMNEGPNKLVNFLDSKEVREHLHVPAYLQKYIEGSSLIMLSYVFTMEASLHAYSILEKNGYRLLHIMGDTDALVTLPGAWGWINQLGLKVSQPWTPITSKDEQLIGYFKSYKSEGPGGVTLATVHGAGHGILIDKLVEFRDIMMRFI